MPEPKREMQCIHSAWACEARCRAEYTIIALAIPVDHTKDLHVAEGVGRSLPDSADWGLTTLITREHMYTRASATTQSGASGSLTVHRTPIGKGLTTSKTRLETVDVANDELCAYATDSE